MSSSRAFWGVYALILGVGATLFSSCQSSDKESNLKGAIYVSASPMSLIVERITGDDFPIQVIVPEGEDITSYKATLAQTSAMKSAQIFVATGLLECEPSLSQKASKRGTAIDLSSKILNTKSSNPYIWMSPSNLQIIAKSIYDAVSANHPDSMKYRRNYARLHQELERLEVQCKAMIAANNLSNIFIYRPTLTYYAAAYDLKQVVISEQSDVRGARILLYESGDPVDEISQIANEEGAEYIEINPMEADPIKNVWDITRLLTSRQSSY